MKSNAAPPMDDETDLAPKRKSSERPRRGRSFVESKRRVGNYRVVALLGEGGMAQVHLAVKHGPAGFKKLLVVKSMRDDLVDPIYVRSFMHEARLAAQLSHPNVIQTYEVGEDDGQLFIAMEYVEGQSMRMVQRRLAPKRLPLSVQLRILAELGRGLHHAHTLKSFDGTPLNIVHRDVSPQNVMLTYDGQVKLLDFGIAKAEGSDELTREGMIKGKIDYMAPEQLRGDPVDQRADVFALGVMLWEALTGMRFSGGAEVAEITKMHNRIMGREQKLRNVAPDTPMRLVEICEQAIAVDVADRTPTAEAFERAISKYLSETSKISDSQQLAQIMEGLFASERQKMRALLEEQLRAIGSSETTDEVEVLVVNQELETTSGTPPSQSNLVARSGTRSPISDTPTAVSAELSARPQTTKLQLVVASAIVAVGVGAGIYLAPRRDAEVVEQPTPRAPTSERASSPVVPGTVHVRIEATPRNATARLDGVAISLPFDAQLARDARLHQLAVSAPGYGTVEQGISMVRDVRLAIDLEPEEELVEDRSGGRNRRAVARAQAGRREAPTAEAEAPAPPPPRQADPPPQAPSHTTSAQPPSGDTPMTGRRSPVIESSNPYDE